MPASFDPPEELPADQIRHYAIWFGGARVGTAVETETWTHAGVRLRRDEAMRFLRGDTPVAIATTIEILADRALVPSHVAWTERAATTRHGEAARDPHGWLVTTDDASFALDGGAIPAELAPLVIRRDGKFAGSIFLPARGFVTGTGRIDPVAPHRLVARMQLTNGPLVEATLDLDRDGTPGRIVDGEGVIALRTTAAAADAPYPLVDLVAAASVPITGHFHGDRSLWIEHQGELPQLPGQAEVGDRISMSARLPGALAPGAVGTDRSREIATLVAAVRARVAPDLGAGSTTQHGARGATAGDCTTFALAYHALATDRAIPTRVVTGLRVDGDHLVRHRWAVSWTGRVWIAVDAAFGQAPAGGDLVGLAIHGADDAGLVSGEAALTQVHAASW
ncbi:MAG: transglutaminase domain-containing protein [Proteobacteria bacterium]|nr:transglutaminase domain-containing protein [Pseudomonadota bacterium]